MHGGNIISPPFTNGRELPLPTQPPKSVGGQYEAQVIRCIAGHPLYRERFFSSHLTLNLTPLPFTP